MISLVQMPFADLERPSIGLGLLKAALVAAGVDAKVTYANLQFAGEVGVEASLLPLRIWHTSLVGEWVFVPAVFPDFTPADSQYLDECVTPFARFCAPDDAERLSRAIQAELRRLRACSPEFVDGLARDLLSDGPAVVACSSMFSQQIASLALLKRVRELAPDVVTLLGGANVEGTMGVAVVRNFPWVDAVSSGESDEIIVPLCRGLVAEGRGFLAGELPDGVITRASAERATGADDGAPRATVFDLDALPWPEYDDYFRALSVMTRSPIRPALPVETSRGCWWGGAHSCTFCGLNRGARAYRAKSPERALAEMDALVRRYGVRDIAMVDNVAPQSAIAVLAPRLEERGAPYNIYYEIRPGLTREKMRVLAAGGVRHVQAGVEALHDDLLALMDKGVTVLQNIALLKHAREFGIQVGWHLLTGFPGEKDDWYRDTAKSLVAIEHLQPPASVHGVTFQRFSRYHEEPALHGLRLVPYDTYRFVYPYEAEEIGQLAYYFRDESWPVSYPEVNRDTDGLSLLRAAVGSWSDAHRHGEPPRLTMRESEYEGLAIVDTRGSSITREFVLTGLAAEVIREAVDPVGRSDLAERLRDRGVAVTSRALDEAVTELVGRGMAMDRSGVVLSLATPRSVPSTSPFPGGEVSDDAFREYLSDLRSKSGSGGRP